MELWDIYDAHRCRKGYTVQKGTKMRDGEYHLVVHVCVFNQKDEMLIQKRRSDKPNWPGMWDFSSGGAAIAGENSNEAAARELREELALSVSLENQRPLLTVHFDEGFDDYYAIEVDDATAATIRFEKAEIDGIGWAGQEQLRRLAEQGECGIIPSFIDTIFAMRKHRGNRA